MYALSVVLGALAVVVTCASAVVAARMVRSRDARIQRLQRHISSLQDHYSHEVGKAECQLWNLRGDYDTLRRAYDALSAKAQAEADLDHDLLHHYQELYADSQDWAVDLKRQLEAKTEDHDVLLASYEAVEAQLAHARKELDRVTALSEFYQEAADNSADLATTLRRRLDVAIDEYRAVALQLDSFINGSWSRDDHTAEEVDYCGCVDGVSVCNTCVPF